MRAERPHAHNLYRERQLREHKTFIALLLTFMLLSLALAFVASSCKMPKIVMRISIGLSGAFYILLCIRIAQGLELVENQAEDWPGPPYTMPAVFRR